MRVTFNAVRDGLDAINTVSEQFANAQWQVSSGLKLRTPSDDPAAAREAIDQSAEIGTLDAYTKASNSASSRLSALDSVLGDIVDRISQGLTAATSARGNTAGQTSRDAAASTLVGVRDAIAGDINTTFNGSYLFGGSKASSQPYVQVAGAWTYQGDAQNVMVNVDRSRTVTLAVSGSSVLQGSDTSDVLTVLDNLATAARAGDDTALATGIDALNRAFSRAVQAQSQVGSDEQTISVSQDRLTALRTASASRLSEARDANLADAITRMNQAQVAYKAALGAVSNASQVSLLDYIK